MPPKHDHHRCRNCASFHSAHKGTTTECRRLPPVVVVMAYGDGANATGTHVESVFPEVEPDTWCSKFTPIITVDPDGHPVEQGALAPPPTP